MDIRKVLIFVKKVDEKDYKDVTESVINISTANNTYFIRYKSNQKPYPTSMKNVIYYTNPEILLPSNNIIKYEGKCINGIKEIYQFKDYFRIIFINGSNHLFHVSKINIIRVQNIEKTNVYKYLCDISKIITPPGDNEDGLKISIEKGLSHISQLKQDSFLYHMLFENIEHKKSNPTYDNIYPFRANLSQRNAIQNAIDNRVSIIEGPPGTGKTSTILNLMANLIVKNKSVAMISSKNDAVINVIEKFEEAGLDFLIATCGREEVKKDFFLKKHLKSNEILEKLGCSDYNYKAGLTKIILYNQLQADDEQQSLLKQRLRDIEIEYNVFIKENNITDIIVPKRIKKIAKSNPLYSIGIIDYALENNKSHFYIFRKLHCWLKKEEYDNLKDITKYLYLYYYQNEIKFINKKINKINEKLTKTNYHSLRDEINSIYVKQFKAALYKRYKFVNDYNYSCYGLDENFNDFKDNYYNFIKRFPIIASTTFSLRTSKPNDYLYDYLIMDEASQADILSTLIAFAMAKNVVIIGDSKQLDMVITDSNKTVLSKIFNQYSIDKCYDYASNNALSMIKRRCKDSNYVTLINEHFRCDPFIIDFCNKRFYNNELIIRTEHNPGSVIKVIKTSGYQSNMTNRRQVDEILNLLNEIPKESFSKVGIISPFNNQITLLKKEINNPDIKIATIHKFQGCEKDIIIISTVKNNINDQDDFLNRPDLINVALTRAKKSLYLLVSSNIAENNNSIINDFIDYQSLINSDFKEEYGKINSVFDMMYNDYNGIYNKIFKSLSNKYNFSSESIIGDILSKEIFNNDFSHYGYMHNYPLYWLISSLDDTIFDFEEIKFIKTKLSHIDFLVYNKATKKAVCAIEVDGRQHKTNAKQVDRDKLKNSILQKINIPLIRYNTTDNINVEQIKKDVIGFCK